LFLNYFKISFYLVRLAFGSCAITENPTKQFLLPNFLPTFPEILIRTFIDKSICGSDYISPSEIIRKLQTDLKRIFEMPSNVSVSVKIVTNLCLTM